MPFRRHESRFQLVVEVLYHTVALRMVGSSSDARGADQPCYAGEKSRLELPATVSRNCGRRAEVSHPVVQKKHGQLCQR